MIMQILPICVRRFRPKNIIFFLGYSCFLGCVYNLEVTCPPKDDPISYIGDHQERSDMGKQKFTAEQIIGKLHEADVLQSQGKTIAEITRQLAISDMTYYKWRKEYGGLRIDQAKRLKELEHENQKLRRVVADLSIDNSILKEAARGNF